MRGALADGTHFAALDVPGSKSGDVMVSKIRQSLFWNVTLYYGVLILLLAAFFSLTMLIVTPVSAGYRTEI